MNSNQQTTDDPRTLLLEWLKFANHFWSDTAAGSSTKAVSPEESKKNNESAPHAALLGIMKTWSTLSTAMSEPSAMESFYRSMANVPDIVAKYINTGMSGYFKLQQQFLEKMNKLGKPVEPYSFENLDQETLRAWSDLYEKEIRQYLQIPQLGLNRFYQERINQTIDKYNLFNTTFTEFLHLLSLPFEKTFTVMQDKLEELTRQGNLPEDSREYYRMWIKILEGHFMNLFKSAEYTKALGDTLATYEDFLRARNRIIQDALQSLPIPTNKDMDDLYKEIYVLKKRLRQLEKAKP